MGKTSDTRNGIGGKEAAGIAVENKVKFSIGPTFQFVGQFLHYATLTGEIELGYSGTFTTAPGGDGKTLWSNGPAGVFEGKFKPDFLSMEDFTWKSTLKGDEVSLEGEATWKSSSYDWLTGKVSLEATAFEAEHEGEEWKVSLATLTLSGGLEAEGEREFDFSEGHYKGSVSFSVNIVLSPNWTSLLTQALKQIAFEFLEAGALDAAFPVTALFMMAGAFIELGEWMKEYKELCDNMQPSVDTFMDRYNGGLSQACPAEQAEANKAAGSGALPSLLPTDNTPSLQGFRAGQIARDAYWSAYIKANAAALNAKVDQGMTYNQAIVTALDPFNDSMGTQADALAEAKRPFFTNMMKSQMYDAYFAKYSNDDISCMALFMAWFCPNGTWVKDIPTSSLNNYKTFAGHGAYVAPPGG